MEKLIQACIFDLDGVLTETAHLHYSSWKRLAAEWGFDLSPELNKQLKGVSRKASLDLILKWSDKTATDEEKAEMMERKNQWYLEEVDKLTPNDCLPCAIDFLDELDKYNIPYALGSGSKNAKTILAKIGLTQRFKWILDGNDVQIGKPNPELFIKAADAMNSDRSKTVVFEDAEAGISAALKGGFIAVSFGTDEEPKRISHFHLNSWEGVSLETIEMGLNDLSCKDTEWNGVD